MGIVSSEKYSPFLLKSETLDQLANAAADEPAILDLVGGYTAARENLNFYADQVVAELEYYGVPVL